MQAEAIIGYQSNYVACIWGELRFKESNVEHAEANDWFKWIRTKNDGLAIVNDCLICRLTIVCYGLDMEVKARCC